MLELTALEARILASLIEKQATTPEYYPLTLNALTNACNQKSNRHPVVAFEETYVARGLEQLQDKGLVVRSLGVGSKVPKYRQILPDRLPLDDVELACVCELMLRGPQTVGELKARASRMHPLDDLQTARDTLDQLMQRDDPVVTELPREPGRKECRYAQLLCGEVEIPEISPDVALEAATLAVRGDNQRITELEQQVATLQGEIRTLKDAFSRFQAQFE